MGATDPSLFAEMFKPAADAGGGLNPSEIGKFWQESSTKWYEEWGKSKDASAAARNQAWMDAHVESLKRDKMTPEQRVVADHRKSAKKKAEAAQEAAQEKADKAEAARVKKHDEQRQKDPNAHFKQHLQQHLDEIGPSEGPDTGKKWRQKLAEHLETGYNTLSGGMGTIAPWVGWFGAASSKPWERVDLLIGLLSGKYLGWWPALPGSTSFAVCTLLPHGHLPQPTPLPWPVAGMMRTGSLSTLIHYFPQTRLGDWGISPACAGPAPFFKTTTGSSSVFVKGARAVRSLDLVIGCRGTAPLTSDEVDKAHRQGGKEPTAEQNAKVEKLRQQEKAVAEHEDFVKKAAPDPVLKATQKRDVAFKRLVELRGKREASGQGSAIKTIFTQHFKAEFERYKANNPAVALFRTLKGTRLPAAGQPQSPLAAYLIRTGANERLLGKLAEIDGRAAPGFPSKVLRRGAEINAAANDYLSNINAHLSVLRIVTCTLCGLLTEPDDEDQSPEAMELRAKAEGYFAQANALAFAFVFGAAASLFDVLKQLIDALMSTVSSAITPSYGMVLIPVQLSVLIGGFPMPDTRSLINGIASKLANGAGLDLTPEMVDWGMILFDKVVFDPITSLPGVSDGLPGF